MQETRRAETRRAETRRAETNKEYMLFRLRAREAVLKKRKAKACVRKDEDDQPISNSKANSIITRCNKDLRLIALFEYLLLQSQAVWIDDPEAIAGFEMLCDPSEHR